MALTEAQKEKQKEYGRRYYAANREKANAATRKWQRNNRSKTRDTLYKWRKDNPEKQLALHRKYNAKHARRSALERKYGLTPGDYDELLTKQGGCCALCTRTAGEERYGKLHIDHCHTTGKVRGLLCMRHNTALGLFNDDETVITKALDYIRGQHSV